MTCNPLVPEQSLEMRGPALTRMSRSSVATTRYLLYSVAFVGAVSLVLPLLTSGSMLAISMSSHQQIFSTSFADTSELPALTYTP